MQRQSEHQLGRDARIGKADIPLEERIDFRLSVLTSCAMNYQPHRSDTEAVLIEMVGPRFERSFAGLAKAHVAPSVSVRADSHETVFGRLGAVQGGALRNPTQPTSPCALPAVDVGDEHRGSNDVTGRSVELFESRDDSGKDDARLGLHFISSLHIADRAGCRSTGQPTVTASDRPTVSGLRCAEPVSIGA
jgi:hypothetical protein